MRVQDTDTGDDVDHEDQGSDVDDIQRVEGDVVDPDDDLEADEEGFVKVKQDVLNKRIGKEVGKRKEAEEKAARALAESDLLKKRFDGENGKIVLGVAKKLGVLPELLSKEDAAGLSQLEEANDNVSALERMLDDDEAKEFTIGNKQYSRKEVRGILRDWKSTQSELSEKFGDVSRTAAKSMQEIIALGMKAKAAGWTGEKKPAKEPDDDKGGKKPSVKPATRQPGDEPLPRVADKNVSVTDRNSLAAFMATQK